MNVSDATHDESEIFAKALELPFEARGVYLAAACGGDRAMRERLEALVNLHGQVGDFLEVPAPQSGLGAMLDLAAKRPIQFVGRYRLAEKLGEGGCGVVYLAEQTEPVRRQVALKIIKPGMSTREVVARFEAERQALALMDHPGIAKVFDAGETDSGQPYFVMELIRGIRITKYCDQNALTIEERLRLFIQVCEAVQHAHQKGIIHRDIKPSNVLVMASAVGTAQPVVIDFGVAKATNDLRLTDKTILTSAEMLIGTPTYMSPEQTVFTSASVDTRSDIYSLGVLLHELLVGVTPFDAGELHRLGIDELCRVIREQEPTRLSARLGRMTGAGLTEVTRLRKTEPRALIRSMRGDLDLIVLRALEKDPARRYATANGLAFDVGRHLNNEPVSARPPSAAYRLNRAIRRNKLAFGAAGAVAVALAAGTVMSTWQLFEARKAQRETEIARREERRQRMESQAAEKRAEAQALAARRIAYSSDMTAVEQALQENNLGRARELLERQEPEPGEADLRHWEWRYLWGQARADDHEVFFAGPRWSARPPSFSADGRMLARDLDGATIVTDLASRDVVWKRAGAVLPVFLHRGDRLACLIKGSPDGRETIVIVDLATRQETPVVLCEGSVEWIGLTPDDRAVITVSIRPGTVRTEVSPVDMTAWDLITGTRLWQRTLGGRPPWMRWRSYAISADGTAIAAALPRGQVQVLGASDGAERFTITVTQELSISVNFSPDNATLLTSAGFSDPTIRLWDAHSGGARGTLDGHNAYVTDMLFVPDGSLLITSGADQTIRLWDWTTKHALGALRGHVDEVDGIAMAMDGRTLASRCKDGSIYLWDLSKRAGFLGYKTLPSRLSSRPEAVQFTPDSRFIVGVELSGGVAVWDAETTQETRRLPGVFVNKTTGVSPDSRWIVTRSDSRDALRLWNVDRGSELQSIDFAGPREGVADWKFIDGGKRLVTVSGSAENPLLELWDVDTWQLTDSVPLRFEAQLDYSVKFDPKTFALAGRYAVKGDGGFHILDINNLDEASRLLRVDFESDAWGGSPDGRMVVAADSSGTVFLWDVETLQPITKFKSFSLGAHSVSFSPDNRRLAAGSNGREAVRLWDVATWQQVLTLRGEGSRIGTVKFSPDGRHLLAINDAGLVQLWTAPTWEEIAGEEAKSPRAPGDAESVTGPNSHL